MNNAIKKKLITESIRGWFVLDNILFNGNPEKSLTENTLKKYLSVKKKYLKTVFEFYDKIGYKSSFNVLPKNSNEIESSARVITESLKKDLSKEFTRNEKKYCKLIAEGVDYKNDDLYLVIGSDNLEKLYLWKNIEKILENYVIVFQRGKTNINRYLEKYDKSKFIIIDNFQNIEVSSTEIRNGGTDNVDKNVLEYIRKNQLYKQ